MNFNNRDRLFFLATKRKREYNGQFAPEGKEPFDVVVNFRLSEDTYKRLQDYCYREELSAGAVVFKALDTFHNSNIRLPARAKVKKLGVRFTRKNFERLRDFSSAENRSVSSVVSAVLTAFFTEQ